MIAALPAPLVALDRAGDALARRRVEAGGVGEREALRSAAARTIAAASGCSLPRSTLAARRSSVVLADAAARDARRRSGLPFGQRPGLVDDERVDLFEPFERLGVADEDARFARRARRRP